METKSDYPLEHIKIHNSKATAEISYKGAQVVSWCPTSHEPVLWLSDGADFSEGKAIRGGVPICWPWFGEHPTSSNFPSHGFVRKKNWELVNIEKTECQTVVEFKYDNKKTEYWPYASSVYIKYFIGDELRIELTTHNEGQTPFLFTQALHTYFHVGDIEKINIKGLEGHRYIDTLNENRIQTQQGDITVNQEIDRIYCDVSTEVNLYDPLLNRKISVKGEGGNSVIVWNPWIAKTKRLGDMGKPDSYRKMICIETANAREDNVTLVPGESFKLVANIKVEQT